jgi:hypothetical protein
MQCAVKLIGLLHLGAAERGYTEFDPCKSCTWRKLVLGLLLEWCCRWGMTDPRAD